MFKEGSLEPLLKSASPVAKPADGSISTAEVEQLVLQKIPDATVLVAGTGCDFEITVISEQFADLSLVKKQQLVLSSLTEPLADGRLHAVSVKNYTPTEWQAMQQTQSSGLLQIKS